MSFNHVIKSYLKRMINTVIRVKLNSNKNIDIGYKTLVRGSRCYSSLNISHYSLNNDTLF